MGTYTPLLIHGHLRTQHYGPWWSLTKIIWINPYWQRHYSQDYYNKEVAVSGYTKYVKDGQTGLLRQVDVRGYKREQLVTMAFLKKISIGRKAELLIQFQKQLMNSMDKFSEGKVPNAKDDNFMRLSLDSIKKAYQPDTSNEDTSKGKTEMFKGREAHFSTMLGRRINRPQEDHTKQSDQYASNIVRVGGRLIRK